MHSMIAEGLLGRDLLAHDPAGNVIVAETAAREFEVLPLDYALALVCLYADKRDHVSSAPRCGTSSGTWLKRTRRLRRWLE